MGSSCIKINAAVTGFIFIRIRTFHLAILETIAKTQTPDILTKTCERNGWPSLPDVAAGRRRWTSPQRNHTFVPNYIKRE